MLGIPSPLVTDAEPVAGALHTAAFQWSRAEHREALIWLRRAAKAALVAGDAPRAVFLDHHAATVQRALEAGDVRDIPVESEEDPEPPTLPPPQHDDGVVTSAPPVALPSSIPVSRSGLTSFREARRFIGVRDAKPFIDAIEREASTNSEPKTDVSLRPLPPIAPVPRPAPANAPAPALARRRDPLGESASVQEENETERSSIPEIADILEPVVPPGEASLFSMSFLPAEDVADAVPTVPAPATSAPSSQRTLGSVAVALRGGSRPSEQAGAPVDLVLHDAFADVPAEQLALFQELADHRLFARGEGLSGFGLAIVLSGNFSAVSVVSDMAAARIDAGSVLRNRCAAQGVADVRLVCRSDCGFVAVWSEGAVVQAFRALPWVEQELCDRANRVHALVGATLGPLGDELDAGLLADLASHMHVRVLVAGELLVGQGELLPGFIVVGVGVLDVFLEGKPCSKAGPGDLLFSSTLLDGAVVPATVRASSSGAVVLVVDRPEVERLLMTFPPLLDLLARQ